MLLKQCAAALVAATGAAGLATLRSSASDTVAISSQARSSQASTGAASVFAHYMVGNTYGQTAAKWTTDITAAQSVGIDGFALNIGTDDYTATQLGLAYEAAESAGFNLFISFDMQASSWDATTVSGYINTYKSSSAQFKVNDLPFVSTFEGPSWADNWASVRSSTGGIYLVPDWASLGATQVGTKKSLIDGAFNWGGWPNANSFNMTSDADKEYQSALGSDKSYMMCVSPYFYTDLTSKNWYSTSDTLWWDRWVQVMDVKPDFIELVTWNDYGESSYLNAPDTPSQITTGAEVYVTGFDHTAFTAVLPYFIKAYKAGSTDVALDSETAVAWYRTTDKSLCGDGGTVWGQGGTASAASGTNDVISVIALSNTSPAPAITVEIGDYSVQVAASATLGKAAFYTTSFAGRTGAVTVTANGKSATGTGITSACPSSGHINFNAVALEIS